MTRLKRYLTFKSLVSVYYSLIYPYLYYGCPLWGNNYEAPLSKLSGAHHPEHPTPMCSCKGVFTSWAIFRSVSLFRENYCFRRRPHKA